MVVPLGHSKEKDVNVFFEAVRLNIKAKLSSDLREFNRSFKFMITFHIALFKRYPIVPIIWRGGLTLETSLLIEPERDRR